MGLCGWVKLFLLTDGDECSGSFRNIVRKVFDMILFCCDLDHTLIYSYRHEIGEEKQCVEIYQDREVSFITKETKHLLEQIKERVIFVPVTTRTKEQYQRIDLGFSVNYALICNGGVLLVDGKEDREWYQQSMALIEDCREGLKKAEKLLEQDCFRNFEVRNIRNLFLFTKSEQPLKSIEWLKENLAHCADHGLEILSNGNKIYVLPKRLQKGMAVRRLKKWLCMSSAAGQQVDYTIAAGDSLFDISMFREADRGFAPKDSEITRLLPGNTMVMSGIFSEEMLKAIGKEIMHI